MADQEAPEETPEALSADETDALEETPETPAEQTPPAASESPASASVSAASEAVEQVPDQLETHLRLLRDNLNLVQQRLENHGSLFGAATNELRELMGEMKDTMTLHQQVVSDFDQHVESLGLVASALTKLHQQVMKALNQQ